MKIVDGTHSENRSRMLWTLNTRTLTSFSNTFSGVSGVCLTPFAIFISSQNVAGNHFPH